MINIIQNLISDLIGNTGKDVKTVYCHPFIYSKLQEEINNSDRMFFSSDGFHLEGFDWQGTRFVNDSSVLLKFSEHLYNLECPTVKHHITDLFNKDREQFSIIKQDFKDSDNDYLPYSESNVEQSPLLGSAASCVKSYWSQYADKKKKEFPLLHNLQKDINEMVSRVYEKQFLMDKNHIIIQATEDSIKTPGKIEIATINNIPNLYGGVKVEVLPIVCNTISPLDLQYKEFMQVDLPEGTKLVKSKKCECGLAACGQPEPSSRHMKKCPCFLEDK